jgi:predicted nucleic acid-binding protein
MNAVDTNVLIYVHDPRDSDKQQIASSLITSLADGVLLWQVACEYIAASRKLEPLGYSRDKAWEDIRNLQLVWITVLPSWQVLVRAENLMGRFHLSFWDAMVVAASLEGGVERLYSEDFDAYAQIDGLELVNPFKKI